MSKKYFLTEQDKERLDDVIQWHQKNQHVHDRLRARRKGGGGGGISMVMARIVQGLAREDVVNSIEARDYYEIELLDYPVDEWSATHGIYYVGDKVKYNYLIYVCRIEHQSSASLPPTATSHWELSTYHKAWVFGYSGDLLEAAPWFQVNEKVEVIRYEDPRFTDREWWILATVTRIADGDCYSLMWNDDENRLMAVYG